MWTLEIPSLVHKNQQKGSALIVVTLMLVLSMVAGLTFMNRSVNLLEMTGLQSDSRAVEKLILSAQEIAEDRLDRVADGMMLSGKLQYVGGPTLETFNNISATYVDNPNEFLADLIATQALSPTGAPISGHEFGTSNASNPFSTAFPITWTDPDLSDGEYYEVKYTFTPTDMFTQVSPQVLRFEYEYRVQTRAYGQKRFQSSSAEDTGIISVLVQGAPFSQYSLFMNSMLNQNGSTLVFAGGNTSAQIQEVYGGPVHVNQKANFYGHPVFLDRFTSGTAETTWTNYNVANYSCCAQFLGGKQGGVPTISMPTQIFNVQRLAAGDTSLNAATNNNTVTDAELRNYFANHATGSLAAGATPPPDEIYIPTDGSGTPKPKGGIFVQGDAKITLNVAQGMSDFPASQWPQIAASDQTCKFQKIAIQHLSSGINSRDIYVADEPCNKTYIFDATAGGSPVILDGRINGNLHVNGKIDALGGESRTRPAIAQDFSYTISAKKDVRIINDIQYEDAKYVSVASDGTLGSTYVADPRGELGSSGILPTAERLTAKIDPDSQTVLGIISTHRNIYLHINAPSNINLHAALFAGNSAAYDAGTGLGCGTASASKQGCGFGYEGWNSETGKGNIKFFGSLSEFKDQTTGVLSSPPKGYGSLFFYDARLKQTITPPAFPITDTPQVYARVLPYKTWRIAKNGN